MEDKEGSRGAYHLVLEGEGVTIDKMVDGHVAGAIARLAFSGVAVEAVEAPDPRPSAPLTSDQSTARSGIPVASGQRLSLREYLQHADVDRGIHGKILAVGSYLRDHEEQGDFTREDVRARFRSAGEPQPANFHRDFQKAVRAGWIAEDHQNAGRFYVTRTGDDEINRRQGSQATVARNPRPRRRVRRQSANDGLEP
jgi:hypothetical protein